MTNIDYDELKKESFLRQKVEKAFPIRNISICLWIHVLTNISIWVFSVPFIITTPISFLTLCYQLIFAYFTLGRYMIKKNISELKSWLIFRKNHQLKFIVRDYGPDSKNKIQSFEDLIKKLTNNFEPKNYEYFVKFQSDAEIYGTGLDGDHDMTAFNEILYITFRKQEDAIAFKMMA